MTLEQLAEDMERTAFEKFITAPPFEYSIERMTHLSAWPGNYRVVAVQLAWEGWKARATYQRPCRGVAHPGCDYLAHVGLFAISVGNKFERTEMTLQERLRDYINDTHDCRLRKEAADRIDELEKEPNLLNVAWLQGEFSELQAKVEVLLNEHAERGVRIGELETTIRKMAMTSLSVEGQWSDKVDDLEAELEVWKKDSAAAWDLCDERRVENSRVIQQLEAKQARIDKLEGAIERMRVAGGSVEFQGAFELAKDLLCRNASS